MVTATNTIEQLANQEYRYGFVTDIEADAIPRGLNEGVIRLISAKKNEPEFLLEWRLKAYRHWLTMEEPEDRKATWGQCSSEGLLVASKHDLTSSAEMVQPWVGR